jgi:antirestriction protein ArdC
MPVSKKNLLERFSARLQQMLDSGNIPPWQKPWTPQFGVTGSRPHNAVTGQPYRGFNRLDLNLSAALAGYDDPRWMGYRQAIQHGWQVRKGETASLIHLPVEIIREDRGAHDDPKIENTRSKILVFKRVAVFNAEQVDGIPAMQASGADILLPRTRELEALRSSLGVQVVEVPGSDKAYYAPASDRVHIPSRSSFHTQYGYDSTLAHELTHASGHSSRLARELGGTFGSLSYAAEEIAAEVGSYLLCQELGVPYAGDNPDMTQEQHAAYTADWAKLLRADPVRIAQAVDAGVKASLYLSDKLDLALEHQVAKEGGLTHWGQAILDAADLHY